MLRPILVPGRNSSLSMAAHSTMNDCCIRSPLQDNKKNVFLFPARWTCQVQHHFVLTEVRGLQDNLSFLKSFEPEKEAVSNKLARLWAANNLRQKPFKWNPGFVWSSHISRWFYYQLQPLRSEGKRQDLPFNFGSHTVLFSTPLWEAHVKLIQQQIYKAQPSIFHSGEFRELASRVRRLQLDTVGHDPQGSKQRPDAFAQELCSGLK